MARHPDNLRLWTHYLNYRQTDFSSFTVFGCVQVYKTAFAVLIKQQQEDALMYLLMRVCALLRQAGYVEWSMAILQAMMEMTWFHPPHASFTERVVGFEAFWTSNAIKFGQQGARGWAAWTALDKVDTIHTDHETVPAVDGQGWLAQERALDSTCRFPLSLDGTNCCMSTDVDVGETSDPYRIVLYEDIRPFLFPITLDRIKKKLVLLWFRFLGIPVLPFDASTISDTYGTDVFLHDELLTKSDAHVTLYPFLPTVCPPLDASAWMDDLSWKTIHHSACMLLNADVDVAILRSVVSMLLSVDDPR
jgi:hypothetical protein